MTELYLPVGSAGRTPRPLRKWRPFRQRSVSRRFLYSFSIKRSSAPSPVVSPVVGLVWLVFVVCSSWFVLQNRWRLHIKSVSALTTSTHLFTHETFTAPSSRLFEVRRQIWYCISRKQRPWRRHAQRGLLHWWNCLRVIIITIKMPGFFFIFRVFTVEHNQKFVR